MECCDIVFAPWMEELAQPPLAGYPAAASSVWMEELSVASKSKPSFQQPTPSASYPTTPQLYLSAEIAKVLKLFEEKLEKSKSNDSNGVVHNQITKLADSKPVVFQSMEEIEREVTALHELYQMNLIDEYSYRRRLEEYKTTVKQSKPSKSIPTRSYQTSVMPIHHKIQKQRDAKRNVRIFISSTFTDMSAEREALLKEVFPMLQREFNDRGVNLSQVDLRWGITANQSEAGDTLDICLQEIDKCRPYFFCMLGGRYGWSRGSGNTASDISIDKTFKKASVKFPWVVNRDMLDRSITEIEIRHAVLRELERHHSDCQKQEDIKKRSFFFFLHEDEIASRYPSDVRSNKKLIELKDEIESKSLNVTRYRNTKEFTTAAVTQLKATIEADFPIGENPSPLEQEIAQHTAFQESRAKFYVGRGNLQEAIGSHIYLNEGHPLVVVGESGCGKSALLSNWVVQHREENPQRLICAHYIGASASSSTIGGLLRHVMGEIAEHYQLTERTIPSDPKEAIKEFPEWIGEADARGGMVLIIDALDQLDLQDDGPSLRWLPKQFSANVSVIVSTTPQGKAYLVMKERQWKQLQVELLNPMEKEAIVEEYMRHHSKTLTSEQLSMIVNTNQTSNALFLRTLLDELRIFGSYELLNTAIQRYTTARDPVQLFQLIFKRLEDDFEPTRRPKLIADALSYLACARRGLSEQELQELVGIPQALWAPVFFALRDSLIDRDGYLTFFHNYMREAVQSYYFTQTPAHQYRNRLSSFFSQHATRRRQCEEVPYLFYQDTNWLNVMSFITDIENFKILNTPEFELDLYQYWKMSLEHDSTVGQRFYDILSRYVTANLRKLPAAELFDLIKAAGLFLATVAMYPAAQSVYELIDRQILPLPALATKKAALSSTLCYLSADIKKEMGLYVEAVKLNEKAISLVKDHQQTKEDEELLATVYFNQGTLYRIQGRYDEARDLLKQSKHTRMRLHGSEHPLVAEVVHEEAILYQFLGKYEIAERKLKKALQMRESKFGSEHPTTVSTVKDLADLYSAWSRFTDALTLAQNVVDIYKKIWGAEHPLYSNALLSIAAIKQQMGLYEESKYFFKAALKGLRLAYGSEHPDIGMLMSDYGGLYLRQNMFDKAEKRFLASKDIRKNFLGDQHPEYGKSLHNIASLRKKQNRLNEAIELYKQSLTITEQAYGKDHKDRASILINIAGTLQLQKKYKESLPLYVEAIAILIERLGVDHSFVAITMNDIAILCFNLKLNKESEKVYLYALQAYEKIYGHIHPSTAQVRMNFASFYKQTGNLEKAIEYYKLAEETFVATLGDQNPKTIKARDGYLEIEKAAVNNQRQLSKRVVQMEENYSYTDFDLIKVLGKGPLGMVHLVQLKSSPKEERALKRIQDAECKYSLLPHSFLHPFLNHVYGYFRHDMQLFIVQDYLSGGDLFYQVYREKKLSENSARFYAAQVFCALQFLHRNGVLWLCIPEDILLDRDGNVKITDYWMIDRYSYDDDTSGRMEYFSPEMVAGEKQSQMADWWSFGCVLFEMLTGLPPFYHKQRDILSQKIASTTEVTIPKDLSDAAKSMLSMLLAKDKTKRMVDDIAIQHHPFFSSIDWKQLKKKQIHPPWGVPSKSKYEEPSADMCCCDSIFMEEMPMLDTVSDTNNLANFEGFIYVPVDEIAPPEKESKDKHDKDEVYSEESEEEEDCDLFMEEMEMIEEEEDDDMGCSLFMEELEM
eukprot:TRINITY_DN2533_c0_g1_i3.p1 TRINITY_DN2533_c0_g1~~TRINITY_DN2533_c0_g1_i3.p1  ORF type:complete len:1715 (-),score=402.13 TRINITY_DN2533_c0_g1_i3:141-5285(-)